MHWLVSAKQRDPALGDDDGEADGCAVGCGGAFVTPQPISARIPSAIGPGL